MPNTPNIALPYPVTGDAPNVPSHIQSLATTIDDYFSGGWEPFNLTTAGSSGINYGSGPSTNCAYKMLGEKTAAIRLWVSLGTSGAVTGTLSLGPLPFSTSGYNNLYGSLHGGGTSNVQPCSATTSGTQVYRFYYAGGTVGPGAPWTWGAGHIIRINGIIELA